MSNYPNGFANGVNIREVPVASVHRRVYYVGNHPTLVKGEVGASNANDGSFYRPWATIDNSFTYAKKGDLVYVRPGHAETIADATSLVPDVAGVSLIGMGNGESRPTISFATATTANIPVSGADTRISNMIFKCNIASQVAMITTTADGIQIDNCSFREGTATGLNFITVGAADADSDRLRIVDCDFYMPTAGNGDHAIEILKDMTNVVIENCDIDGDFDEGGILIPAGGDAQVNLQIKNCNIKNRLTNIAAISISGTDSSGLIQNCLLRTDTRASALDNGSLATDNVRWADETDQVTSTSVLPDADSATNFIGVDDADNLADTSNVVANRDGSILERLEHVLDCIVDDETTNALGVNDADNAFVSSSVVANRDGSLLERSEFVMNQVTQGLAVASVDLSAASPRTIYTITGGPILIHFLGIKITAACSANAALVNFNSVPTVGSPTVISKVACAPDLQSAAAGDWFAIGGGSAEVAIKYATGSVLPDIQSGTSGGIVVDAGTITVVMSTDNLTTGTATAYMAYTPLSAGVTVA